jgi:hypothetical protein
MTTDRENTGSLIQTRLKGSFRDITVSVKFVLKTDPPLCREIPLMTFGTVFANGILLFNRDDKMFIKVTSAQSLCPHLVDVGEIESMGRNYSGEKVSIKFKSGAESLYIKESEDELIGLLDSNNMILHTEDREPK